MRLSPKQQDFIECLPCSWLGHQDELSIFVYCLEANYVKRFHIDRNARILSMESFKATKGDYACAEQAALKDRPDIKALNDLYYNS